MCRPIIFRCLIGWLFWLSALSVYGNSLVAEINDLNSPFDLAPYIEYFIDPARTITYEELRADNHAELWQQNKKAVFNGDVKKSRYWFRVSIKYTANLSVLEPVLYVPSYSSLLTEFTLWIPEDEHVSRKVETGNYLPYDRRDVDTIFYAFNTPKTVKTYTVYGWIDQRYSTRPSLMPLFLLSSKQLNKADLTIRCVMSAFYAAMCTLLVYNACLFASLRQAVYGYYLLFLISAMYTAAMLDSTTLRFLLPNAPELNLRLGQACSIFTVLCYMAFLWEALTHLSFSPQLRKLFYVLASVGILALLNNIFTPSLSLASAVSQLYPIFTMPLILLTILAALQKKIPTAGYFFVAEFFMLVGSISFILVIQGIFPLNSFSIWSLHGGILSEATLLSLALASRTRAAEQAKTIAEAKNEAKSQFFASMSHEFRTPITAILGYSEAARVGSLAKEEILKNVEIIERGGKHLLQLVNDILDLSKIDAQKFEVEKIDVSIADLLRDIDDYFSILAAKNSILFAIDCQFPLPSTIFSDPTRLKQILLNICGNAVKFTEQGSVSVKVSCNKYAQKIMFAVKDTGIGLRPEQVNKLFSAFTQVDASTTRNFGGTGLGLHLSKQIAEKLGGDIAVTSEYGKGSTFTVTVSTGKLHHASWLSELPNGRREIIESIEVPKLSGHVLYAEDNPQNQELIATLIKQTGCTIDTVSNGQKALEYAMRNQYDLIFTDIRMPMLDGVELTKALLANNADLLVVAITAAASDDEIEEFKAIGFKQILRKPLDRRILYSAMSHYLPAKTNNGAAQYPQKVRRVLLAEDNLDNQGLIKLHLKNAGCETVIANDGLDALGEVYKQGEFDLVLMDMQMPHMNGMTAVRYLRDKGYHKPIYSLTADETPAAIQECLDAGCNGYLSKPLDTDQLIAVIQSLR